MNAASISCMFFAAASALDLLSLGPKGYGDEMLWGLLQTFQIAIFAYILGLAIGCIGAMAKLYGSAFSRAVFEIYTTVFRAIPSLILILLLYYAGTDGVNQLLLVLGFGPIEINGLVTAICVLAFLQGAYSTEVIRAAIQSVPSGQFEAAKAYGMSGWKMFRRITLPAMLPNAIPGLSNLWLVVTKETVLISVVGFTELLLATRQAAGNTKFYFTFYFACLIIFWMLSELSGLLFSWLERRVRRSQPKLA
jgi:polar amino acid transport system permease protein